MHYGLDYNPENESGGAHPSLVFGDRLTIRSLADVSQIPTEFDFEEIKHTRRHAFDDSNVHMHQIVNVNYLIYRLTDIKNITPKRRKRRIQRSWQQYTKKKK